MQQQILDTALQMGEQYDWEQLSLYQLAENVKL